MQPLSPEKDLPDPMNYEVYLSMEEINEFLRGTEKEVLGYCYEWEGENVFHIHTRPLTHPFGIMSQCLFIKGKAHHKNQTNFVVTVTKSGTTLYKDIKGKLQKIQYKFIPDKKDLYSRSKGILEVDILSKKHVCIVGLGSFGSQIAIELAKAGVGEFSLIDFDRIELHNLARHTCTIKDLGRLKTDAIEEAILGKNPYAKIHKYPIDISVRETFFGELFPNFDLVICATDNNSSRFLISSLLYEFQKVGIFGRAITRAAGGDVFRYQPGGPCYACLINCNAISQGDEEISSEEAGRRSGVIPAYASKDDVNSMVQVGLSVDIEPICNLMLKLALVELSKGQASGIASLEQDLKYDAYVWANRREKNFENWSYFYKSGSKNTILKWYGVNILKDENCVICSDEPVLDTGYNSSPLSNEDYANIDFKLDAD